MARAIFVGFIILAHMHRGTILITGATGFIGQAVVPRFLDAGFRVRGLLRPNSTWPFAEHPNLERVVGDMRDGASLERACEGMDGICHLAAAKADEAYSAQTNVDGARHLRSAAEKSGMAFIINISTQSAKLVRRGIYAKTKADADAILSSTSVPVTTLYPSLVCGGKGSGAFEALWRISRLPVIPVFGGGNAVYYPIHRNDLAELIVRAADAREMWGKNYDAGGPEAITLMQMMRLLASHRGRSPVFLPVSLPIGLLAARLLSFLPRPPFTTSNVLGGAESVTLDSSPLYRAAAFTPRPILDLLTEETALLKKPTVIDPVADEFTILSRYILPRECRRWKPGPVEAAWYAQALRGHLPLATHSLGIVRRWPFLLGGLDAITKRFSNSPLQKKLLIVATIVECHPVSAAWLLPQDHSHISIVILALRACARTCGKMLLGAFILPFPGFVRRHGSHI